jgi:CelD/BcsL family acetyltransferase involved in cellulose biosynthesis
MGMMDTQSPYQIDRLATLAQLDTLKKDWTDLVNEIPGAPIFLTWEWIRTWWLYFGQDRELWLLTARDKQGKLLGLAPLMREFTRMGWLKIRMMAFIGTGRIHPVHLNILAHPSDQKGLYQAFLNILLSKSDQWDVISFASVAQDSTSVSLLMAAGGSVRIVPQEPLPYIPLPSNWEIYLKAVSKKLRRNLKYFLSKLEDDYPGRVIFACVTDPRELQSAMEKLEELNKRRWHAIKLFTPFYDPTYSSFHQTIACQALNRGWLRLYTLTVVDRVIALFYCFHFQNRVYAYQIGFDLDWSGYSPGRLLIAYGIQTAIQESASELDWGPGDDDYKLAWTDQIRVENEILFSGSWRGGLWIKWKNFQGILKIKAKQWLPQTAQLRIKQFLSDRQKLNLRGAS